MSTERLGWPPKRWWRDWFPFETQSRLCYDDDPDRPSATCHLQLKVGQPALCGYPYEGLVMIPARPKWNQLHPDLRCEDCSAEAPGVEVDDDGPFLYDRSGMNEGEFIMEVPSEEAGFTDAKGRRFLPDPTGAAVYRINHAGTWKGKWLYFGTDGWGDKVCAGPGQRVVHSDYVLSSRTKRQKAKAESDQTALGADALRASAGDRVAGILEFIGFASIVASVIGGLMIVASASDVYPTDDRSVALGWAVAIAGSIQGFLLVGFGRAVRYLSQIVASSRQSAEQGRQSLELLQRATAEGSLASKAAETPDPNAD